MWLTNNRIDDSGMEAIAAAVASGALDALEMLSLWGNRIGDAGMTAFAGAVGSAGALAQLTSLNLESNNIGDGGVQAFASVIANRALASLAKLVVFRNPGTTAFLEAECADRGIRCLC